MPHSPAGRESIRHTLQSLELRCPPLPRTLGDALELMEQPEKMEVGQITHLVQRDPIVVARLLHTVNSSYYGLRQTVSSADRAVVILGPVAVAGIVLGMQMLQLRSVIEGPAAECFQRLIRHSTTTAYLTRFLLDDNRDERSAGLGLSFTAGLLHDIGRIILVYNFPNKAVQLYDRRVPHVKFTAQDKHELERLHFGCDHTEAGEFAARKLNFPEALIQVIRHHHTPDALGGTAEANRLIRATAAADLAANAMGYGVALERGDHTQEALATSPLWEQLVETDLPQFEAPRDVIDALIGQQPHLDRFLGHAFESAA